MVRRSEVGRALALACATSIGACVADSSVADSSVADSSGADSSVALDAGIDGCFEPAPAAIDAGSNPPPPCTGPIRTRSIEYGVVAPGAFSSAPAEAVALADGSRLVTVVATTGWERSGLGLGVLPADSDVISYGERPGCVAFWGSPGWGPIDLVDLGGRAGAVIFDGTGGSTATFDGRWSALAPIVLGTSRANVALCEGAPIGVVLAYAADLVLSLGTFDWRSDPATLRAPTLIEPTPPAGTYTFRGCHATASGVIRTELWSWDAATSVYSSWIIEGSTEGPWAAPFPLVPFGGLGSDLTGDLRATTRTDATGSSLELDRLEVGRAPTRLGSIPLGAGIVPRRVRGAALAGGAVLYLVSTETSVLAVHWDGASFAPPWLALDAPCELAEPTPSVDGPSLLGTCGEITICNGFDPRYPP